MRMKISGHVSYNRHSGVLVEARGPSEGRKDVADQHRQELDGGITSHLQEVEMPVQGGGQKAKGNQSSATRVSLCSLEHLWLLPYPKVSMSSRILCRREARRAIACLMVCVNHVR